MRGDDLDQTSLLGVELTAVNHQVGVGHAADGDEHGDPQAQVAGGGDDETSPHELNGVDGFVAARLNPPKRVGDEVALEDGLKLPNDVVDVRDVGDQRRNVVSSSEGAVVTANVPDCLARFYSASWAQRVVDVAIRW